MGYVSQCVGIPLGASNNNVCGGSAYGKSSNIIIRGKKDMLGYEEEIRI